MLQPQTLKFLSQLKKNNNRQWFESHRVQYEAARIDFANFIDLVIVDIQKTDVSIAGNTSKDCIFRINRDIRFSKDKTPYKSHFGAIIKPEGRKSIFAGYYFHLAPGNSFTGGGLWMPEPPELKKVRQEIDYNYKEFKSILENKNYKKIFSDIYQGDEIKINSAPKGYEKDNPALSYLQLKCFISEAQLKDEELTKSTLHKKTVQAYKALQPFISFLNRAVSE